MRLWRRIKEFFKDIREFLKLRNEQREKYGEIMEDLETINALSLALRDQIGKFAKRYNLYPEINEMVDTYRKYLDESQKVSQQTRRDILNQLFEERSRKLAKEPVEFSDTPTSAVVHRHEVGVPEIAEFKSKLVQAISERKALLGKTLAGCEMTIQGNTLVVRVDGKAKIFVPLLLRNKAFISEVCEVLLAEPLGVEIQEVSNEN